MHTLNRINKLPHELVSHIYEFIPGITKCVLNKKLYHVYYPSIKLCILKKKLYDNYVRDMIRKDYNFVFQFIIKENYLFWLKTKKCFHKNKIFSTYLELLENLCIENQSTKCRNEILLKSGLSKNQHKKNIVKTINREWSN